jgi:hypothetical protein
MPTNAPVQYTIRGIPREVDQTLRRRARQRGISLNRLLVEELSAAGGGGQSRRYRLLKDLGGRWQNDPLFDRILKEQRRIDPDLWK